MATYLDLAEKLVHFSFKGVNSNAEAGGVRLGPEARLDLPYVSARCLLARRMGLAVDYTKNTGPVATPVATVAKQIRMLATDEHGEDPTTAESMRATIAKTTGSAYETGTESVSPRMRQLLLPKETDQYFAITPLPAAGLSQIINARVRSHNDQVTDAYKQAEKSKSPTALIPRRLHTAMLGVGGSNPQNVGSLVREMQSPLVFDAPTENQALREAYRIHYQGMTIRLPYAEMHTWAKWRKQAAAANNGTLPTDLEAREAERTLLLKVARTILLAGQEALKLLETHRNDLPGEALLADTLKDPVIRGLIDPAERDSAWPRTFGERVAKEIGRFPPDRQEVLVILNSDAIADIAAWIEEVAR